MSDTTRELADFIWGHYYNAEQGASKIDAALKAARLEAIEECKEAILTLDSEWKDEGYEEAQKDAEGALDALKEAKNADAE